MSVIEEVNKLLTEAQQKRAWSEITVCVQNGEPTMIRTNTTKKLTEESTRSDRSIRTLYNR